MSMKPAATTFGMVSGTVAILAPSNSKVYEQVISFPRTKNGMKSSACWLFSTVGKSVVAVFLWQTSAAAAIGKSTSPGVGAAKGRI